MKTINKLYHIIIAMTLLIVVTSCDDEELFKTVVAETPEVTFNFYDAEGNPSERGLNAWKLENPILTDPNATAADINFTFISEFVLPAGITVDSVTVQYQADFVLGSGGSAPRGWEDWETVLPADDRLDGDRLTYTFNIAELNAGYDDPLFPLLTTGRFGIVKDNNNGRVRVFLSDGRDFISSKVVFWYPVVPGEPE